MEDKEYKIGWIGYQTIGLPMWTLEEWVCSGTVIRETDPSGNLQYRSTDGTNVVYKQDVEKWRFDHQGDIKD